jgi:hypothetical protein
MVACPAGSRAGMTTRLPRSRRHRRRTAALERGLPPGAPRCRVATDQLRRRPPQPGQNQLGCAAQGEGVGLRSTRWWEDNMPRARSEDLADDELLHELERLHATRHDAFLHGAPEALAEHTSRTTQLEQEYLRRHSDRDLNRASAHSGARGERDPGSAVAGTQSEGADQPRRSHDRGSDDVHRDPHATAFSSTQRTGGPEGYDPVDALETETHNPRDADGDR